MKPSTVAEIALFCMLSGPLPALAQGATPAPSMPPGACSPTVSAVLDTWDAGMATAEKFGERATALAREKGREYLLPLLGIDPGSVKPAPGTGDSADSVAREVEASRKDPARRAALCAAVTQAMNEAKAQAGAGLDALKRAVEGLHLPDFPSAAPPAPAPAPAPPAAPKPADPTPTQSQGLIKT